MEASGNKSALSTVAAVILTAIIVGSIVGGATSYIFSTRSDSMVQEVRADLKAVADAAGIPVNNADEMKKLMEERKVVEAAKQEGKVVVGSASDPRLRNAIRSRFESKYPFITVEFSPVGLIGAPDVDKFIGDFDKGVKSIDVFMPARAVLPRFTARTELLAKYIPKDSEWLPADLRDKEGMWASSSATIITIAYNTKLVPKDQAPKSFQDLLDSKWSGKIVSGDPKMFPFFGEAFRAYEKQFGEQFMRQLEAQKIQNVGQGLVAYDKLAAGEFPILISAVPGQIEPRKQAGQPVDWVRLSDNTYFFTPGWIGIASNAPHPNAARLWVDFYFSKEGQQIFADAGGASLMPDIRVANLDLVIQGKKLIVVESLSDADRKAFLAKYPALAP